MKDMTLKLGKFTIFKVLFYVPAVPMNCQYLFYIKIYNYLHDDKGLLLLPLDGMLVRHNVQKNFPSNGQEGDTLVIDTRLAVASPLIHVDVD